MFVWILSEFLSEVCLSFGEQRNNTPKRVVKRKIEDGKSILRDEFLQSKHLSNGNAEKENSTRKEDWDFLRTGAAKRMKREKTKRAGLGPKGPIRLLWGPQLGPLISLFRDGKSSQRKRGQKGGIFLFYPDGLVFPLFSKAIL